MPNELKPCKYCNNNILDTLKVDEELFGLGGDDGFFQAHCYMCGAKGPVCESREKAIEAWNRRAGEE